MKAIKCGYCGELVDQKPYKEIHLRVKNAHDLRVIVKFGRNTGNFNSGKETFTEDDVCDECLGSLFRNLAERFKMDCDEPTIINRI